MAEGPTHRGNLHLILLADANILLDFGWVEGLPFLAALGPLEVLDNVLLEASRDPHLPELETHLKALGVTVIEVPHIWTDGILAVKRGKLSFQDATCLFYGQAAARSVLTNERELRKRCTDLRVDVHGSLWVVEQLHTRALCQKSLLCDWLRRWPTEFGAFLPTSELERLRRVLGCP